ncbi:MAG: hypothetical protein E7510_06935 [Ruminococcus sp.]|nr:hypothetical protein [Ruminococcus sp.]
MKEFIIDECIKDQFELYCNICSHLSEHYNSEFAPPATLEKIEQWEKDNDTELPHQYKSWLLLSSESNILDGYLDFIWPELGVLDEKDDSVVIGSRMGDGEALGIMRSSGIVFTVLDGEVREFDDFEDFLTCMQLYMERLVKEHFGKNWAEDFNKKFGY